MRREDQSEARNETTVTMRKRIRKKKVMQMRVT